MTERSGATLRQVVFIISFLWLLPFSAFGADNSTYATAKAGFLFFTDDPKDSRNYTAFDSEFTYGYYLKPTFTVEVGAGYIHDGHKGSDIRAYPLRVTAKVMYPVAENELYAGGGIGIYRARNEIIRTGVYIHDHDTVLGGHMQFGANVKLSSNRFFIIEGEFLLTEDIDFDNMKSDLNGFSLNIGIGFRL